MSRILIVDDSRVVGKLLSGTLTADGHDVQTAASVNEAIEIIEKSVQRFALVITDLIMPDRDGIELVDYLHKRGVDHGFRPKIIVISGGSKGTVSGETAVMTVKDRVETVLVKPFTQPQLVTAVSAVLG